MILKPFKTGLLAASVLAATAVTAPALASGQAGGQSPGCADVNESAASLTRDDWATWTTKQKQAAKPASTDAANKAAQPTTRELAEQYNELLKEEKAEPTKAEPTNEGTPEKSAANDKPATTGSSTQGDRAAPEAEDSANVPKSNAAGTEHYSAPNGGFSSGAHIGNESPTDTGNSANGMEESKSAERMRLTDCKN